MTSALQARLNVSSLQLAAFCDRHQIQELAVFGSILRQDFSQESDVDLLVSFKPGTRIGFLALSQMQRELEELLGRKVDLVPKSGLKPAIRDEVLAQAEQLYAA